MRLHNIIGYAYNALIFLFDQELLEKINAIYIFGSAVRGELDKTSDVDLFLDCKPLAEDYVQVKAQANVAKFYKSADFEKWRRLGITNTISITAGELKKWSLRTSVASEGLLLYKKTPEIGEKFERKVIIVFDLPKIKSNYLRFVRRLFGRKDYAQKGILAELHGERLSSNIVLIPQANLGKLQEFFRKNKIKYTLMQVLTFKS